MSSIKCSQCGLVNWATQENCKRCGVPVGNVQSGQTQYSQPAYGSYGGPESYQPYYAAPATNPNAKMGLAIASLVLSLIGCGTAPIGLILGIVAYKKATRYPVEYGGKGFAIAGIAISSVMMFFFVPIVAAIAIPNLLAARRAANEGSAIHSLRKIADAQERFAVQERTQECADLSQLRSANYLDPVTASGERSGYKFTIERSYKGGCEMHAVPISKSSGTRSFYISSGEGAVRGSDKFGLKAGPDDPILRN